MLTPFITLFGLILFGCEQDNSENNNENNTEITEVVTHDIDAANADGFYYDLVNAVETDSSESWHLSFQMLPVVSGNATYMMPSFVLGEVLAADYTDVNNFAEGYVFNNYNQMFRGNRNIENAIFHTARLNYFNFNMFNFTNLNGGVSYTKRVDAIKTSTAIDQINQASSPINSNFVDEVLSANGRFQKTFRKWKANLSANVSYSELNNIINTQPTLSQNFTQNYQGSVETNFKNAPNFEVGYNRSINNYQNGNSDRVFYTDRPFANMDVKFLNGFTLTADWSYYNYYDKDDTVQNEYSFFEAGLRYQKPESKWEFRLDGTNLFNVDSLNNDSFNETFSTTTEYFVMPRIVMLSVKYNL